MIEPERFRSSEYLAVLDSRPSDLLCRFTAAASESMASAALRGYPHEVCGLLIGRLTDDGWQIVEAREVANLNTERAADRFQLDPAAYQAIDREIRGSGNEIIGVFHSHPDAPAKPSPTDLANSWEGFLYPILSVDGGDRVERRCWTMNSQGERFQPVSEEAATNA